MKLRTFSRRWTVLNYAVTEPDKWTTKAIAEDLDVRFAAINEARHTLTQKGLIAKGKQIGRSRAIIPTPAGVDVFNRSLSK